MKRLSKNDTNPLIVREFEAWLSRQPVLSETMKISPGTLQDIAVKNNLCMATWKEDCEYIVCGLKLWEHGSPDPYYCKSCYNKLKE